MIEEFGSIKVVLVYGHYPGMNKLTWPINLDKTAPEDLLKSVLGKFALYKNKNGKISANKNNLYGVFISGLSNKEFSDSDKILNLDQMSKLEAVVLNNDDGRFERYLKKNKERIVRFLEENGT